MKSVYNILKSNIDISIFNVRQYNYENYELFKIILIQALSFLKSKWATLILDFKISYIDFENQIWPNISIIVILYEYILRFTCETF